ncbi:MAG: hypothetical protein ABR583_01270 [Gaiellaceae bacterium]
MSGRQWQRLGALAGFLFVALTFATIFAPSEPDAEEPTSTIAQAISDDRTAHVFFTYLGEIGAVVFLLFVAALWNILRRAESEAGASMVALMGGLGFSVIEIGRHGAFLALVEAADKGREQAAIRALLELDNTLFTGSVFFLVAFHAGVSLSVIPLRSLPIWLGWWAAALALLFAITALGIFSEDYDGPLFGVLLPLGLLAHLLWVLAASLMILRTGRADRDMQAGGHARRE